MPKADIPDISEPVERKMNPIFTSRNHSWFEEFNHLSHENSDALLFNISCEGT